MTSSASCFRASFFAVLAALSVLSSPSAAFAAEPPADPADALNSRNYYGLGPSFVTNYDGAGRLKYLKTDISVRLDPGAAALIDKHLPYLRNRMVVMLTAQIEENLTSTEGKELLRLQALGEIRTALDFLEGPGNGERIQNLYFTAFVLQR
jgi:flagellar FliL protein